MMSRIYRTIEAAQDKPGSGILVFYGEAGLGKTSLLLSVKEKYPFSKYYQAIPASSVQQAVFMQEALFATSNLTVDAANAALGANVYDRIFDHIAKERTLGKRQILIFDEFDYLLKADDLFMTSLQKLLSGAFGRNEFLVILCTSSLGFVAGTMSKKMGRSALLIQGLLKVKEFSFSQMSQMAGDLSYTEQFYRYALMGGRPFPYQVSMRYSTMRDMIIGMFLQNDGLFYDYGIRYISEHLREPGVYATILYLIANGHTKLNDLYLLSGFSRAKISVYLKNLIELDLVEKVYSYDASPRDDSLKGVYRICNPMVNFWYRFIYARKNQLQVMQLDAFFDEYIMNELSEYLEFYYAQIASQMILEGRIAAASSVKKCDEWVGKSGDIPIIASPEQGGGRFGADTICAFTSRTAMIDEAFLTECSQRLKKASLKPKTVILFTEAGVKPDIKISMPRCNVVITGILG